MGHGSEGFWEQFDEDFDDETGLGDKEEDSVECWGKYHQYFNEACEVCGQRKECMAESPSKLDEVLETMGVKVKDV